MIACVRVGLPAYLLVCGCLLSAGVSYAQTAARLETGFERDVNRYRWLADARLAQQIGRWEVEVANRFTSDAFLLFGDRLNFRDENRLRWEVERPIRPTLTARAFGDGLWYSQSRVWAQHVFGAVRYAPRPYAWAEPMLGAAWDRRPGIATGDGEAPLRLDVGPAFGGRLFAAPPPINDYRIEVNAQSRWQLITPRRGRSLRADGMAERRFGEARLALTTGFASLRRDVYQAVSFLNRDTPADRNAETIEATTSDTLLVGLDLDTPAFLGSRFTLGLDYAGANRFIRTLRAPEDALFFDTDFDRQGLGAEAALLYDRQRVQARLSARIEGETETRQLANRNDLPPVQATQKANLLQQADYTSSLFSLSGLLRAPITPRAILSADGTSSILRHDTPDINPDDRDEVYHTARLGALLRLSRYLTADLSLFGSFVHTVYLNAIRSAENTRQRSLRLRPGVTWQPSSRTQIRLTSEVRATYTVDDFVLAGRRRSDQSAREMRYDLSAEHDAGQGVRLMAEGGLSDLHLGRLLWDQFAEIPFDTLRTYRGWLHVQVEPFGRLTADVGVRFFVRSDFDRAVTVRYPRVDENGLPVVDEQGNPLTASITRPGRTWIEQIGPTCALLWPMRGGSTLRLDGWMNIQHVRRRLYGDLPDASADRIRRAGRQGQRTLIPNVALTVVWNL